MGHLIGDLQLCLFMLCINEISILHDHRAQGVVLDTWQLLRVPFGVLSSHWRETEPTTMSSQVTVPDICE